MQDYYSHRGQGYKAWNWGGAGGGWLIGGVPGSIIGGWGHLWGSIWNDYLWGNGQRPDNADDYRDAFNAANDRTYYWVERWMTCCYGLKDGSWKKDPCRSEEECSASPDYSNYPWADKAPPGSRVDPPPPPPPPQPPFKLHDPSDYWYWGRPMPGKI